MSVPWLHSESQDLDIGTRHFLNLEQSFLAICLSDHKGLTHAFIAVWPMAAGMSVPWDYLGLLDLSDLYPFIKAM